MKQLKLAPGIEIALLKRRIKTLEHLLDIADCRAKSLERDRMQARELLHQNMAALYRASMRLFHAAVVHQSADGATRTLHAPPHIGLAWQRACARAAKMAKKT